MTIDEVLDVLVRDRRPDSTTDLPSEHELDNLEEALGMSLPSEFRALLARLGGGIFYDRHELFGARRLMVHDIELVPDLVSFRDRFARSGSRPPGDGFLPFHRSEGRVHLLDLRGTSPRVVSDDGQHVYADLASFLEQVVLPPGSVSGRS